MMQGSVTCFVDGIDAQSCVKQIPDRLGVAGRSLNVEMRLAERIFSIAVCTGLYQRVGERRDLRWLAAQG